MFPVSELTEKLSVTNYCYQRRGVTLAAVVASTLLFSGCATLRNMDTSTNYDDRLARGLYGSIGIGSSRMEPDISADDGFDVDDRVEPAGQITVGMDLNKYLSIEAHSADLGSAGLSPQGRVNYHVDGVSALLYAGADRDRFKRQGLTAYGRLGMGKLENTMVGDIPFDDADTSRVLYGAGVEYMTAIGVGVRAEGFLFNEDAKYAQLALMYRMGRKRAGRVPMAEAPKPVEPVVAAALVPAIDQCATLGGVLEGVTFASNSADIVGESAQILDGVASTLARCSNTVVEIAAHTDSVGSQEYNHDLSKRRAVSVVKYLHGQGLISQDQLRARAYGELSPRDSNDTAEGRARNRRVELRVR